MKDRTLLLIAGACSILGIGAMFALSRAWPPPETPILIGADHAVRIAARIVEVRSGPDYTAISAVPISPFSAVVQGSTPLEIGGAYMLEGEPDGRGGFRVTDISRLGPDDPTK